MREVERLFEKPGQEGLGRALHCFSGSASTSTASFCLFIFLLARAQKSISHRDAIPSPRTPHTALLLTYPPLLTLSSKATMGRSFYSAAYQPAVTIAETPADAHPEPARWADAQFDPDADAFFDAADAVHEQFLSAEEALARAQADVAAARAARFEPSPPASADTSGAGTPTSEHAATAQAWQNGQWTTLFAEM
jgi:hypothetical protein